MAASPGERSWLGLVWAVLERASRGRRGVTMTPAIAPQLQMLRQDPFYPEREAGVITADNESETAAA